MQENKLKNVGCKSAAIFSQSQLVNGCSAVTQCLSPWSKPPQNPQTISHNNFQHNSISIEISFHFHPNSNPLIATKFCTCHDSCAVMSCAKLCSNMIIKNVTAKFFLHGIRTLLVQWVWGLLPVESLCVLQDLQVFYWPSPNLSQLIPECLTFFALVLDCYIVSLCISYGKQLPAVMTI